jgi:Tol biopolymer transport system component
MRMTRTALLTAMALGALLVCGVTLFAREDHAQAAFPGADGKIAFLSQRENPLADIYVMNPNGSSLMNLTSDIGGQSLSAHWSPDGHRIVFEWNDPEVGNQDVWVMNEDGSNKVNLTHNRDTDTTFNQIQPKWSPDGNKIVYVSSDSTGNTSIHTMNADGSHDTVLETPAGAQQPDWGTNGKIAFVARGDTFPGSVYVNYDIYTMNADGTGLVNLSNTPAPESYPSWSPDSSKIAFMKIVEDQNPTELFAMDANGTNLVRLTENTSTDYGPKWSPSGTKITFGRDVGGQMEVFIMNADGSKQANITNNPAHDYFPDWQPTQDTTGPTGTVVINGGAKKTQTRNVVLTLSASDPEPGSGVVEMRMKNSDGDWSEWMPYATTKAWLLSAGQGKKGQGKTTVYVQYRDAAGNLSDSASDAIVYRGEERPKKG